MVTTVLLTVLFICGLIKTFFFSLTKFISWLSCLFKPPATTLKTAPKMTQNSQNTVDKAELEMVFSTFDKNGDGFITKQELVDSLEDLGLFSSDKQISSMVETFDSNGDGLIDLNEFCELYSFMDRREDGAGKDGAEESDALKEAFDVFDENGDGLISVDELRLVFSSLGLKQGMQIEECKNMIKKVDRDGDGMVNFHEFKLMMQSGRPICVS